jgi:hypothetical protein
MFRLKWPSSGDATEGLEASKTIACTVQILEASTCKGKINLYGILQHTVLIKYYITVQLIDYNKDRAYHV